MTQRLTDMHINRVSIVDKGANARRFAVLKRDEEGPMTDQAEAEAKATAASWFQKAADWLLGKPEPVTKVATFAEIVAGAELRDALYDSWYTLEDALWGAIYAVDENGESLAMEAKQALVGQNLDEFKTYLVAQLEQPGIAKRDASAGARARASVEAVVSKVGRKISGSRLERLQAAAEALTGVLAEVEEAVTDESGEDAQEVNVDKAELEQITASFAEAIAKAQGPLLEKIESIEKRVAKADPGEAEPTTDERLDTIEKILLQRVEEGGVRKSLNGQDGNPEPVRKSVFAGILD